MTVASLKYYWTTFTYECQPEDGGHLRLRRQMWCGLWRWHSEQRLTRRRHGTDSDVERLGIWRERHVGSGRRCKATHRCEAEARCR